MRESRTETLSTHPWLRDSSFSLYLLLTSTEVLDSHGWGGRRRLKVQTMSIPRIKRFSLCTPGEGWPTDYSSTDTLSPYFLSPTLRSKIKFLSLFRKIRWTRGNLWRYQLYSPMFGPPVVLPVSSVEGPNWWRRKGNRGPHDCSLLSRCFLPSFSWVNSPLKYRRDSYHTDPTGWAGPNEPWQDQNHTFRTQDPTNQRNLRWTREKTGDVSVENFKEKGNVTGTEPEKGGERRKRWRRWTRNERKDYLRKDLVTRPSDT